MRIFSDLALNTPLTTWSEAILQRTRQLHLAQPWSTCELHGDEEDYLAARDWLAAQSGWTTEALLRGGSPLNVIGRAYARQACYGLLWLFAAGEAARRFSIEGEIWTAVRKTLAFGSVIDSVLYVQGQPRAVLKEAIESAATAFGLRNVCGAEGVHEWISTVYLQFGTTRRGLDGRLPEWLVGQGRPLTVQRLLDGTSGFRSDSFAKTWNALTQHRRRFLPRNLLVQELRDSSWILPEWVEMLADRSLERLSLGEGSGAAQTETEDEHSLSFLTDPRLEWNGAGAPSFFVEILTDSLNLTGSAGRLLIGDQVSAQLTQQQDGSIAAFPSAKLQIPLDSAEVDVALIDGPGDTITAAPLALWDATDEIALFKLPGGERISDPWSCALAPGAAYALLLTEDLEVQPEAAAIRLFPSVRKKLCWITAGSIGQTVVQLEGETFWQPIDSTVPRSPLLNGLRLRQRAFRDQQVFLSVLHPHGSRVEGARFAGFPLEIVERRPDSTHLAPISFAATAARLIRVRLRVSDSGHTASGYVDCEPEFVGLWERTDQGWSAHEMLSSISVATARSRRFRVLPPPNRGLGSDFADWALMEGDVFQRRLRKHPAAIGTLGGFGAPLTLRCGPYNADHEVPIVKQVIDPGIFRPQLSVQEGIAILQLRQPLDWSHQHRVLLLREDARVEWCEPERYTVEGAQLTIRTVEHYLCAVAIAWNGARLGTVWSDEWTRALTAATAESAASLAAVVRWLRLPILQGRAREAVEEFARRFPAEVLAAWLTSHAIPSDLLPPDAGEPWLAAVRDVFWDIDVFPAPREVLEITAVDHPAGSFEMDVLPHSCWLLAHTNPMLMVRVLRAWWEEAALSQPERAILKSILKCQFADLPVGGDGHLAARESSLLEAAERMLQADGFFVQRLLENATRHFRGEQINFPFGGENVRLALNRDPFRRLLALRLIDTLP
jgi:hypothetical protein